MSPAFRPPRDTLGASLTAIVRWTQWSSSARCHCAFQKVVRGCRELVVRWSQWTSSARYNCAFQKVMGDCRVLVVPNSEHRDCRGTRTLHARIYFPPYSLPTGCGGNARTCLDLGLTALRLRNMKKVWPRTFLSSFGSGYNMLRFRCTFHCYAFRCSRRFSRHSWCE